MAIAGLQNTFEFGLLAGERIKVGIGFGVSGVDLIQAGQGILDVRKRFLHVAAHRFIGIELRFLRQVANFDVRLGSGFAIEIGVDTGHDSKQGRFS